MVRIEISDDERTRFTECPIQGDGGAQTCRRLVRGAIRGRPGGYWLQLTALEAHQITGNQRRFPDYLGVLVPRLQAALGDQPGTGSLFADADEAGSLVGDGRASTGMAGVG